MVACLTHCWNSETELHKTSIIWNWEGKIVLDKMQVFEIVSIFEQRGQNQWQHLSAPHRGVLLRVSGALLVWSGPGNPAAWRRSPAASSSSWAETAAAGSPCWGSSPRWKGPPAPSASPRGRAQSAARPEARRGARPCRQSSVSPRKI